MVDLSDFKRGQILGACIAGARVSKPAELFGLAKDYCLDRNDSIWERRKNIPRKKAKAVWLELSDSYVDC